MKVWVDIKNSHEPLFFRSIIEKFPGQEFIITCREFAEIVSLLEKYGLEHEIIGGRPEGNFLVRVVGFWWRVLQLLRKVPSFDLSLSHSSVWGVYTSWIRRRSTIVFTDNDINDKLNKRMFRHVDHLITPNAIPLDTLQSQHAKMESVHQFNGYKEDIYIADYSPDPDFIHNNGIPFSEFVTIRPENLQAIYVGDGKRSIVPDLFRLLKKENTNVLFLPRHNSDRKYANGYSNIHIPESPLNGLDVCHFSQAVLTGAGTFSREAACMGTPAVSFFPGKNLLAVDRRMVSDGWVKYSRDSNEIIDYVLATKKHPVDLGRSKKVQKEVFAILSDIFDAAEKRMR